MRYTTRVRAFGGIDENRVFSDDLAYSPAMRNYKVTENRTLQKRFGQTTVYPAQSEITGIWSGYLGGKRYFLYTAGGMLYSIDQDNGMPVEIGEIGTGRNVMFEFNRRVYIKNETQYSCFDGEKVSPVTGYVPLVAIGCSPAGAGTSYEDVNMLSRRRRVRFSGDGTTATYRLPEQGIEKIVDVQENGSTYALNFTWKTDGTVTFEEAPGEGLNNVEITYEVETDRSDVILRATGVMLFGGDTDGHVFLWGNPDYPAYRFHSELADGQPSAEYFPENNYTVIGDSEITDIISQYDRQLIFTKDRAYYSYCELQTDTLGNVYASFPVYNLNGEKGSLMKNAGCIMNNEPVTLCADGLNKWTSTAVENEKNAVCFSGAIGKTMKDLLAKGDFERFRLYNLRATGELFFLTGSEAFIYNYRIGAWYAYDNFEADFLAECDGTLYFSRGDRILFLDPTSTYDEEGSVHAYWETPYNPFGETGVQKKLTEISLTVRAAGTPQIVFSYFDSDMSALPQTTKVEISNYDERVLHTSFRPPLHRASELKLRIDEHDYAFCELIGLQIVSVRKGRYGRKGV